MRPEYIFIAGMEKCGSTALAGWLISNRIARYPREGVKEPYDYARPKVISWPPATDGMPLLDASVGYAMSERAIDALPEHATKIIVCLRNPLERAWSAYLMKKMAMQDASASAEMARQYDQLATGRSSGGWSVDERAEQNALRSFPRRSAEHVRKHFKTEVERLKNSDFASRVRYEQSFQLTFREYPFLSVMACSFYYWSLKKLLEKYQPEDVLVLSVARLSSSEAREHFMTQLIGEPKAMPEVPFGFSTRDFPFAEERPDFHEEQWAPLRDAFRFDHECYRSLLSSRGVDDSLLDWDELGRYLDV